MPKEENKKQPKRGYSQKTQYEYELYVPDEDFAYGTILPPDKKTLKMPLFPENGPSYRDVIQKVDASCFLLAPMASIAKNDPEFIRNMIRDNDDGTVTVRFYADDPQDGGNRKALNVRVQKTPINGLDSDSALWVKMVQKAFAASGLRGNLLGVGEDFREANRISTQTEYEKRVKNKIVPIRELDGGSSQQIITAIAPRYLDGNSSAKQDEILNAKDWKEAYERFAEALLSANNQKMPIVLETSEHVFSVMNVEKKIVQGAAPAADEQGANDETEEAAKKQNYEYVLRFYDQLASKRGIQTVDLRTVFDGKCYCQGHIVEVVHCNGIDQASHTMKDMQHIPVGNFLQQKFQQRHPIVSAPMEQSSNHMQDVDEATQNLLNMFAEEDRRAQEQFKREQKQKKERPTLREKLNAFSPKAKGNCLKELKRLQERLNINSWASGAMKTARNTMNTEFGKLNERSSTAEIYDALKKTLNASQQYLNEKGNMKSLGKYQLHRVKTLNYMKGILHLMEKGIDPESPAGERFMLAVKIANSNEVYHNGIADLCNSDKIIRTAEKLDRDPSFGDFIRNQGKAILDLRKDKSIDIGRLYEKHRAAEAARRTQKSANPSSRHKEKDIKNPDVSVHGR